MITSHVLFILYIMANTTLFQLIVAYLYIYEDVYMEWEFWFGEDRPCNCKHLLFLNTHCNQQCVVCAKC